MASVIESEVVPDTASKLDTDGWSNTGIKNRSKLVTGNGSEMAADVKSKMTHNSSCSTTYDGELKTASGNRSKMKESLESVRWVLSALFLFATAPTFYVMWLLWRLATTPRPLQWAYQIGDDFLYGLYQKCVLFFFLNCTGIELILYGDTAELIRCKENIIFMSNHQSNVDWLIADMLAVRQGTIGHLRYILKDSLKYLPLYGSYFRQHSCIYVKRSGQFQQQYAQQQLDTIVQNNIPFWMVVFPEGTRLNPSHPQVIEKSKAFAVEHGLPVYDKLLTPRPKALQLCIDRLGGSAAAIYDVTVGYSGTTSPDGLTRLAAPSLLEFLSGKCRKVHVHIKRLPITDIPRDSEPFQQWLHERFIIKDSLLKRFYSLDARVAGTLGADGKTAALPLTETLPSFLFWSAFNLPLWLSARGLFVYGSMCIIGAVVSLIWAVLQP